MKGLLVAVVLLKACGNTTTGALNQDDDGGFAGGGVGGANTGGGMATGGSSATGGAAGSGAGGATGGTGGSGGTTLGADASADAGISCSSVDDCPPSSSSCRIAVCDGLCGYTLLPAGPAVTQVSGDCRRVECEIDGATNTVVDSSDFDDLNPCTADSCTNGLATHTVLVGAFCSNGEGTCDASGSCLVPI